LAYDQALLLRAADIKLLHERRIQIRGGKTDLPKRRAELAVAENQLKRLAAELEWDTVQTAQVIARLPSRAKIANARTLLNRRGELHAAKDIALASMGEADDKHTDLTCLQLTPRASPAQNRPWKAINRRHHPSLQHTPLELFSFTCTF
jgi:hypothetical protein